MSQKPMRGSALCSSSSSPKRSKDAELERACRYTLEDEDVARRGRGREGPLRLVDVEARVLEEVAEDEELPVLKEEAV